jgi:hypothetical protein
MKKEERYLSFWKGVELGLLGGFMGSLAGNGMFKLLEKLDSEYIYISSLICVITFGLIWTVTHIKNPKNKKRK